MTGMIDLNDQNFDTEVISSSEPVIVDFWAEWCGPCKAISPIVEEIAGEFAGKIKVGKVNVDFANNTATRFGIRSIPSLLFFKEGKVVDTIVGAVPKGEILKKEALLTFFRLLQEAHCDYTAKEYVRAVMEVTDEWTLGDPPIGPESLPAPPE